MTRLLTSLVMTRIVAPYFIYFVQFMRAP